MRVNDITKQTIIEIGHVGEKGFRDVAFDVSEWMQAHPSATIHLAVLRYRDTVPYPVELELDGNTAIWHISDVDTAVNGKGKAQLILTDGDTVIGKSHAFLVVNRYALDDTGEVPDPYDDWFNRLTSIADRVNLKAEEVKSIQLEMEAKLEKIEERTDNEVVKYISDHKDELKGDPGEPGEPGPPGDDYVLTEFDKAEIAGMAAGTIQPEIDDLKSSVSESITEISQLKEDLKELDNTAVKTVNGVTPINGNVNVGAGSAEILATTDGEVIVFDELSKIQNISIEGASETCKIRAFKGKNLLNIENITSGFGLTITRNEDGTIRIVGTSERTFYPVIASITLERGAYTFSGNRYSTNSDAQVTLFDLPSDAISIGSLGANVKSYMFPTRCTIRYAIQIRGSRTFDDTLYPMVEYSETLSEYEPYKGETSVNLSEFEAGTVAKYIFNTDDNEMSVIYGTSIEKYIDANAYQNFWKNKKINFLGDSITAASNSYVGTVKDILKLKYAKNYGIGGDRLASVDEATDALYQPLYTRYMNIDTDADAIFVLIGTNDYASQVPIGLANSTNNKEFKGALNTVMDGLRTMFPTKLIVFSGLLNRSPKSTSTHPILLSEYTDAIKERCEAKHMVFFDAQANTNLFFQHDYSQGIRATTDDGLHPNAEGAKILGRAIAGFILNH